MLEHPELAQAAVIGITYERLGQVGKNLVVPKPSNLCPRLIWLCGSESG
ncbi:AMP-binding enzyme [Mycobacterium leprae]|nr:hypothetical protein [Mycobacterium leprae]